VGTDALGWWTKRVGEWAREKGGNKLTVDGTIDKLTAFYRVVTELGYLVTPESIPREAVEAFKHDAIVPHTARNVQRGIAGRPLAPNSIANTLPLVRGFAAYTGATDPVSRRPIAGLPRLFKMRARAESVYVAWLDEPDQLRRVLNGAADDPELQAMVALLGPCQLRPGAAVSVCPTDLYLPVGPDARPTVRVLRGKFGKPQLNRIPPSVVGALLNGAQGKSPNEPIWSTSRTDLWRRLHRLAGVAGVPDCQPRTLRASMATFVSMRANARDSFNQRQMAHVPGSGTLHRRYVRPDPRADDEDVAKVDAMLREA
jgi:integrase